MAADLSALAPLLELREVAVAFGDRAVLRALSLSVLPGEVVFAIGRSGTGKSVLSRVALGLQAVDRGEVWLLGQRVDRLRSESARRAARQGAALVTQGAALLSWLSLAENVALPLLPLGRATARLRSRVALAEVGLSASADLLSGQASAGQRQLAATARALALAPRLVLFDEPTTGLELPATLAVERQIRRAADAGAGVLVVSHDLDSLVRCADRFLLLVEGRARVTAGVRALAPGLDPELDLFLSAAAEASPEAP